MKAFEDSYKGIPRNEWARDDRELHAVLSGELSGIKASYNSLAAEYNSQMSKMNWRFTNIGELPADAYNQIYITDGLFYIIRDNPLPGVKTIIQTYEAVKPAK